MPDMDLLLRGTIVTPGATLENGWFAVEGGRIIATGQGPDAPAAARTIDHGDALILPGVLDGQTHATSAKGMAGIAETTRGALAGGVTTLVDMPYDNPLPLDRPKRLAEARAAGRDGLKWSPFHGDSFSLRVAATYLRGAPVWDGADILNTPGSGRYVARGATGWFADQGHDQ